MFLLPDVRPWRARPATISGYLAAFIFYVPLSATASCYGFCCGFFLPLLATNAAIPGFDSSSCITG
jgi:hypothetical protein